MHRHHLKNGEELSASFHTKSFNVFSLLCSLHLYLLMKGLMLSPVTGAMDIGMGSGVDSQ